MDTQNKDTQEPKKEAAPVKKAAAPSKLPSKPIVFANQPGKKKNTNTVKATVDKSKKGGHLLKKLSGK